MEIIKCLSRIGMFLVFLTLLTGGKSPNEDKFIEGHQACGQFNANYMHAYAPTSHPFVNCHAKVNEKYPVAWDNWSRQNGGALERNMQELDIGRTEGSMLIILGHIRSDLVQRSTVFETRYISL